MPGRQNRFLIIMAMKICVVTNPSCRPEIEVKAPPPRSDEHGSGDVRVGASGRAYDAAVTG
jgi:hypothetical protein